MVRNTYAETFKPTVPHAIGWSSSWAKDQVQTFVERKNIGQKKVTAENHRKDPWNSLAKHYRESPFRSDDYAERNNHTNEDVDYSALLPRFSKDLKPWKFSFRILNT